MPAHPPALPPVRLTSEAELARDALATPLLGRAVRLARWAGPATQVGAGGELLGDQLPEAAEALGLPAGEEGEALAGEAWRVAVDTGLVTVEDPQEGAGGEETPGTAEAGPELALLTGGSPQDVLGVWEAALETVLADAAVPDLEGLAEMVEAGGEFDLDALDWDPEAEEELLELALTNLYTLTLTAGAEAGTPVPLPALAATMVASDEPMGEPSDEVLEFVSDTMMRLDDYFRALEPVGLVEFWPVDEELMADADEEPGAPEPEEDISRYGMVRLTALGRHALRLRLAEAGYEVPVVGDLAGKGADALLDGIAGYPPEAVRDELAAWLAGREAPAAARDLLAAARGADEGAPLRRLRCQEALSLVGSEAEGALREVLDDPELGGLARVWLAERGAGDVPAPSQELVFWLTVDTIAAQLAAEGNSEELRALVEGLADQHSGFFDAAWRVEHPATADVLEAMGRLHPDRKVAKVARKAAFKARSRQGV
ncbi:hypothetical protein [Streptomyces albidoflavus]|uniref:hypothetical protein n=1 Tax=Streptomyces albidoflavus TaxID=1886 RepID=UPI00344AAAF6